MGRHEFKHASRSLLRSPRLTTMVVLTLAIAAGGAGALFNLLNAVVLRQLPVFEPHRLVSVYPANGAAMLGIPGATLDELARRQTTFEGLCGFSRGTVMIDAGGGIVRRPHEMVGTSCGELLGVRTIHGRFIGAVDRADTMQAEPVVVLSHAYWVSAFNADPAAVGRTVRVQGLSATIIGVLDRDGYGMNADQQPDVVMPLGLSPRLFGGPRIIAINAFGRLKPSASIDGARAELRSLWPEVWDATNPPIAGRPPSPARSFESLRVQPFGGGLSDLRDQYRESLYVLFGLATLLLTLAIVNVGGVLLARAVARQHQLAVQLSLGAGYGRLTAQLVIEGLLLAAIGAVLAVPIAWWTSRALALTMWTASLPFTMQVTPDATALAAIALTAFVMGLLVNLPAVRVMRTSTPLAQLATRSAFAATSLWRRVLTVSQVALSVVLVCVAGLFGESLASLRGAAVGFNGTGLHAISLDTVPGVPRDVDHAAYLDEVERRVRAVPGVTDVTFAGRFPLSAVREVTSLLPNYRRLDQAVGSEIAVSTEAVATDFFATLGIPVLQGRAFTLDDRAGRPGVAIINAAMADKLFPDHDVVGRQVKSMVAAQPLTVVGVVANATRGDPRITDAPTLYLPGLQEPARFITPIVVIRATPSPGLAPALQRAIAPLGRHTVSFVRSVDEQMDRHLARERVLSGLSAAAAGLGLLIGALGLFGLLAYAVSVRTRELGLRMALGGTRERVARMIVGEGMALVAIGTAIGLPMAFAAARFASALLYSVAPTDPQAFGGGALMMLAVGAVACAIPALRAIRITPAEALRHE